MKVLFASHLFPNPAEPLKGVFVAKLAEAMAAHAAVEVLAPVTWLPGLRAASEIPPRRTEAGVTVWHPRRWATPGPLRSLRVRAYLQALRSIGQDLSGPWQAIHSHWIDPDACAMNNWPANRGALRVATVHGHAAIGLGIGAIDSAPIRPALRKLDRIVAVSSELKAILVNDFGIAPEKIAVIFNGIDPAQFFLQDRELARRQLGLPQNRRILLVVARLSPEKNLGALLEAVASLPDRDFHLHLAGTGPLEKTLRESAARLRLGNRVSFEGGVRHHELPLWFAAADLFCLSSHHEGCPVVVHEALACGTPVISTRVGAVPDLLNDSTGLLCEPSDSAALADALARGWERKWDRAAIAAEGRRHTWDAVARQTLELYHEAGAGN